jgi:uncharacterized protein (UPF0297 family)
MSQTGIKWVIYDLERWGWPIDQIVGYLQDHDATYEDLVQYIMENHK